MSNQEVRICRFCLQISDTDFETIEDVTREILDVLLLKVDLNIGKGAVICKNCVENLEKCFDFKANCLNVEDRIAPFASATNKSKMNIMEIFLNRNNGTANLYCDICRFCFQGVKEGHYKSLDVLSKQIDFMDDVLAECTPEMDLKVSEKPVICTACEQSLRSYYLFMKNCRDVEQAIKKYYRIEGLNSEEQVDLLKIMYFTRIKKEENEFDTERYEDIDTYYENQIVIKQEELNIKDEGELTTTGQGDFDSIHREASVPKLKAKTKRRAPTKLQKCDICTYQSVYSSSLRIHKLTHQPLKSAMFRCDLCPYASVQKATLQSHTLTHMKAEQLTMHDCKVCGYKSRYRHVVKRHMLIHKDSSDLTMYKCDKCNFETKQKFNLKNHVIVHMEERLYECNVCEYKAKLQHHLNRHMVNHKDPSKCTMYKCDMCTYWTKQRGCLVKHIKRVHKNEVSS